MRPQLSPERVRLARFVARALSLVILIAPAPARAQSRASDAATVRVRVADSAPSISIAAGTNEGRMEITVEGPSIIQVDGAPPIELTARRRRTVSLPPVSNPRATHRAPRLVRVRIET